MSMNAECSSRRVRPADADSFGEMTQRGVVLVDFDDPWCGVCRMQLEILENLAMRIGCRTAFLEVNVDEAQDLAIRCQVQSLLTLVLFKNGQVRRQFVGLQRKGRLEQAISALAAGKP